MTKATALQMAALGQNGEREKVTLVKFQTKIQVEPEIEDWVGVHTLKNLPKSFKPQNSLFSNGFSLIDCIKTRARATEEGARNDDQSSKRNKLTIFFCPPDKNEPPLKKLFYTIKKDKTKPKPQFSIFLFDAKGHANLSKSFEKLLKISTQDEEADQETVNEIYSEINSAQNCTEDQSLFVFVGAKSFDEIRQFLPQGDFPLPFCHFVVTTCSKTDKWEPEDYDSESDSGWSIGKFLMSDDDLLKIDWEGVHSSSKIPWDFQPIHDFTGRDEFLDKLVQRFQNISHPRRKSKSSSTFTVITGENGIGKTELLKKFLSTHHHLFSSVVLTDARSVDGDLVDPLKAFAYDSGLYSMKEIEGDTEELKVTFLHSKITESKNNKRLFFVFDGAERLSSIKNYLPKNCLPGYDVIVTSRWRNWWKDEDVKFYEENHYDFQEIPLFDGLSLEETFLFCLKLLSKHGLLFIRADLDRAISEVYRYIGGFPPALQHLRTSISESSQRHPEWSPKLHILNYLSLYIQNANDLAECPRMASSDVLTPFSSESQILLQIMCTMDPDHLDFDLVCSFFLERGKPFKPPGEHTKYTEDEIERVKEQLKILELEAAIQIDRNESKSGEWNGVRIRIPAFLRESMNKFRKHDRFELQHFLSGSKRPYASWTRPLDVPRLWPHILSLNENYNRHHGYYNEVLIDCFRNHLKFWKTPAKHLEIPGEKETTWSKENQKNYDNAREDINKLLNENQEFKKAFGDFSQVQAPGFFLPFVFFIFFLMDVVSDVSNALVMYRAGYMWYFSLAVFLVVFPFVLLCQVQYWDRTDFTRRMQGRRSLRLWDHTKTFTGTFDSYFLRLWFTWKFRRETENLDKGLLFERLCILRANAEYHSIANAFMESLPQLLLQFPLYLFSYTEEYSDLRKSMRGSFFPYELSLVMSFLSFGFYLTKLESVYFGWNLELFGIKLLGYRIIHLLINATHFATLVFCSGIVCFVFPSLTIPISLVFCLTASAWIISKAKSLYSIRLPNFFFCRLLKLSQESRYIHTHKLATWFASFHPAYVEKERKLESSLKREFVSARLGHDLLFLQRRPRNTDVVYLFVFLSSVFISAFAAIYCSFYKCQSQNPMTTSRETETHANEFIWAISVIRRYSFYLILWLPLLFMWQILRQLLHNTFLKYSKASPLNEDYILNDPEGIFRYPVYSQRWIQKRLYYQMRQNQPSVFTQTWTEVKETFRKFNRKHFTAKLKILIRMVFKIMFKISHFCLITAVLCLVPYNITLLKFESPILANFSNFNSNDYLTV